MSVHFDVSRMTIHRDLDVLEAAGLLRKIRGGATVKASGQFMADFTVRSIQSVAEKRQIAAMAAELIEPGETVVVDDGSTAAALVPVLIEKRPLTIITNNLSVIQKLTGQPGMDVIALGGEYSRKFNGFFGLLAETAIQGLRADVAFISCSAVHGAKAFHQDQEVVQCKRLKIQAAERRYLLVDHSKFGKPALHFLSDLSAFDAVITDDAHEARISSAHVDMLRDQDIDVRIARRSNSEAV
jgi:DeoR/GlpR family transcriptional regulator of sugar metabolism